MIVMLDYQHNRVRQKKKDVRDGGEQRGGPGGGGGQSKGRESRGESRANEERAEQNRERREGRRGQRRRGQKGVGGSDDVAEVKGLKIFYKGPNMQVFPQRGNPWLKT
jgi:hypothetical protein